MGIELVHVGFDNFVAINRIVAITSVKSTSIKRAMHESKDRGLLIDVTHGKKTKAVIFTDSGHVFVVARAPEVIAGRLQTGRVEGDAERGGSLLRLEQSDEQGSS